MASSSSTGSPSPDDRSLASPPARRLRRHPAVQIGTMLAVLALIGIAYAAWQAYLYETTDNAYIEADVVTVSPKVSGHLVELTVTDNESVAQGQLLARIDPRDYELRVRQLEDALAGAKAQLEQRRIEYEITRVTAPADLTKAESGVEAASSSAAASQAQVEAARNQWRSAQAAVARAEQSALEAAANVQRTAAEAERAKADYARFQALFADHVVAQQELDHARTEAEAAQAQLEAARRVAAAAEANVDIARAAERAAAEMLRQAQSQSGEKQALVGGAQVEVTKAATAEQRIALSRLACEQLEAEVAQLEASLDEARLQLSYTTITAPTTGTVARRAAVPGAYVAIGQPLMAIVPPNVWVVANLKETQLVHIRAGQPVRIRIDAFPGVELKGHVASIQPGTGARFSLFPPENATGNYIKVVQRVPVKIVFEEGQTLPPLAPGMSVVPRIRVR